MAEFEKAPVEEIEYEKRDMREAAYKAPEIFAGPSTLITGKRWIYLPEEKKIVQKEVSYVPVLLKVFDELLVNASDNKQRDTEDIKMTFIKVNIDPEQNVVTVANDGRGIAVKINEKHKIYNAELIFANVLSSSNYNTSTKRLTGGINGLGAKLTNIFSKQFDVLTICDGERYELHCAENMLQIHGRVTTPTSAKEKEKLKKKGNLTEIRYVPDLQRFNMEVMDHDLLSLMYKRVVDMAACNINLKVILNGDQIQFKNFEEYVKMYDFPTEDEEETEELQPKKPKMIHVKIGDRWEIVAMPSKNGFRQVSFVNSIDTFDGGPHVDLVVSKIADVLIKEAAKKNKSAKFTTAMVREQLCLFVRCLLFNPTFTTQEKTKLLVCQSDVKKECVIDEEVIKKLGKMGVLEQMLQLAQKQADSKLKKGTDGKKTIRVRGIPKLEDANMAGTRNARNCTLILTEGDSAKSLAVAGLGVIGRDNYGVFPLRGKVINVRDATASQLSQNAEFTNIKKIMGLQQGKHYDDIKDLRYGHLMIMADQDHDGSHIKGLLINMFEKMWPSLLKYNGFMQEFITPIIKATKGKTVKSFYTESSFEEWRQRNGTRGWKIKYYKGLGTSTPAEAKEYFFDLDRHQKDFVWTDDRQCSDAIDLAFSKKRADHRKDWLNSYKEGDSLDSTDDVVPYPDFINKELIQFSRADCMRSIPSVVDGFKPGQRKILYACFKRNLKNEIKVAQLSGYVAEVSSYHHGEQSLQSTIVNLARDFVGSNNINLLVPSGQFGTRLSGGKDAASARYIFTKLNPLARLIFREEDDRLLKYLDDDGMPIEPEWYVPIIPMCLVNGADGIGTGWSTKVPCFSPADILNNIRNFINQKPFEVMAPWYRDFEGKILYSEAEGKYYSFGTFYITPENTVEIVELPIQKWTDDYKEWLEENQGSESKADIWVKDFRQYHTHTQVHFSITLMEGHEHDFDGPDAYKKLGLVTPINTTNMTLFDKYGKIRQYASPLEIMKEFCELRFEYYMERKKSMLKILREQLKRLSNKARFVQEIIDEKITVNNKRKNEIERDLEKRNFDRMPRSEAADLLVGNLHKVKSIVSEEEEAEANESQGEGEDEDEDEDEEEPAPSTARGRGKASASSASTSSTAKTKEATGVSYDYLLSLPIYNLTKEKVDAILKEKELKEKEIETVTQKSSNELWLSDLDAFEEAWKKQEKKRKEILAQTPKKKGERGGRGGRGRGKRSGDDSDSDADFDKKKKGKGKKADKSSEPQKTSEWRYIDPVLPTVKKTRGSRGKSGEELSLLPTDDIPTPSLTPIPSGSPTPTPGYSSSEFSDFPGSSGSASASVSASSASSFSMNEDFSSMSVFEAEVAKKKLKEAKSGKATSRTAKSKQASASSGDMDIDEDDVDVQPKKVKRKASPKETSTKSAAATKRRRPKKQDSDDEDSFSVESDDNEDFNIFSDHVSDAYDESEDSDENDDDFDSLIEKEKSTTPRPRVYQRKRKSNDLFNASSEAIDTAIPSPSASPSTTPSLSPVKSSGSSSSKRIADDDEDDEDDDDDLLLEIDDDNKKKAPAVKPKSKPKATPKAASKASAKTSPKTSPKAKGKTSASTQKSVFKGISFDDEDDLFMQKVKMVAQSSLSSATSAASSTTSSSTTTTSVQQSKKIETSKVEQEKSTSAKRSQKKTENEDDDSNSKRSLRKRIVKSFSFDESESENDVSDNSINEDSEDSDFEIE
ncbi:TOP2, topoisomerase IIA [Monocercomonoides exilis]|uniref:TOP2, topoisomerase IIA n=1 Tax=Monocercomonoides exilis TaxID=2049356 RepID=UPI00355AC9BD|nr:TOP2, topoisomerase IIA [Monocercomonoides exilis]|eukprot:MONOS_2677.1-p1 / transcript=MONOS_2677.1 / gene=MONOS_2677 / organism=Monocercomonoides_exilis_PA203 / gene_product=Topo IIA, topoisomerase II / transcript_product=Topo IIA, topoisomerase II / location=Mono_scaffold00056:89801-94975(+) / protein_length=1725 / sequence_SO=supercontig / SO=protein_coding / is_pseudo=false